MQMNRGRVGDGSSMNGMGGGGGGGGIGRCGGQLSENKVTKDWKLFVGQVPFEANESDLWPVFAHVGNILELVVLRAQGKSKGCAFVTYETRVQADWAIRTLDQQVGVAANRCSLDKEIRCQTGAAKQFARVLQVTDKSQG